MLCRRTFVAALALFLTLPAARAQTPQLSGCPMFPPTSVWNVPVDTLPVNAGSSAWVNSIGPGAVLHPDFGNDPDYGIPYVVVGGTQPRVPIAFDYADESDPGPYPIPPSAPVEGGAASTGDRHILVLDQDNCVLYETFNTRQNADGSWHAGSGALFDVKTNAMRPAGWTSADAGGLPILPGLVRYDEVSAGEIRHAIRFTVPKTQKAYAWPARHQAGSTTDASFPPMGARFRLRASFDVSKFSPAGQVILKALKKYGMILADNGSAWFISGVSDPGWNIDQLVTEMRGVHGSDFEAVDESGLMVDPDSARARTPAEGVVNAASFLPGPVSPGEILTIFGTGLGPAGGVASTPSAGVFPTSLAGVRVLFGGRAAPILYASATQLNLVVPYGVAEGSTVMVTEYNGVPSAAVAIPVVQAIPGIFTVPDAAGMARPVVFNWGVAQWTINTPANPAARGMPVIFYVTGEGQTQPAGADGKASDGNSLAKPLLPVSVVIGGVTAQVDYAGATPNLVAGLMQVNATVPAAAAAGSAVPVVIRVGANAVQQLVTIAIK